MSGGVSASHPGPADLSYRFSELARIDVLDLPAGAHRLHVGVPELRIAHEDLDAVGRNAVEASPRQHVVSISVLGEDRAVIEIHNDGAIPADIRERVFEKYVTSGKPGGVGLGTYSARLMAKTLGGRLEAETSEEAGTTMRVDLPRR